MSLDEIFIDRNFSLEGVKRRAFVSELFVYLEQNLDVNLLLLMNDGEIKFEIISLLS